jgi:signal transduction histidine kinase
MRNVFLGIKESLTGKLIAAISVLALFGGGFTMYIKIRTEKKHSMETILASIVSSSELMKSSVRDDMLAVRMEGVQSTIESISTSESINVVQILDHTGRISYSSDKEEIGQMVEMESLTCFGCHEDPTQPRESLMEEKQWTIQYEPYGYRVLTYLEPIYNEPDCYFSPCHFHPENKKVLGLLKTDFSLANFDSRMKEQIIASSVIMFLNVAAIAIILIIILWRFILKPVTALSKGMAEVSAGDLTAKVKEPSHDELGRLAQSFNRMTGDLRERTAALTRTNVLLNQEITVRKRAEGEIQKSQTMLQAVFDGISDPLILLNEDMMVKILNSAALRYFRVDPEEVIDRPSHQLFKCTSDPDSEGGIRTAVMAQREVKFERQGMMDPERLEEVTVYPIKEEGSKTGSTIIHITDITEARFMAKQFQRNERLITVGLMASGVAHEVKNPLAIIDQKAGLLADILELSPEFEYREKFLDALKSICNAVERSRKIVVRHLEYAKHVDTKIEPTDLNRVLEEVLEFLEREAFHRNINISLKFSPDLPTIESDKGQLQQVFLNIIKNAIEVVEDQGNITIATRQQDQDTVQVSITDDGCGMSSETQEQIFKPFFTSGKESGTGLGLYIAHGIVEQLGGRITVQSEEGKGTTFIVELPRTVQKMKHSS